MKSNEILYPFDEKIAEQIAAIVGPSSAAALALAELSRRRENGEDVGLFCASSALVVGPSIPEYKDIPREDNLRPHNAKDTY